MATSLGDRRTQAPPPTSSRLATPSSVVVDVDDVPTRGKSWWGTITCLLCVLSGTAVGVWAALR